MSNRNFDNRVIIQRLQNQVFARNLYTNNISASGIINNPQNSDGSASRYTSYIPGVQTEYYRGLIGNSVTVSQGGIVNLPPFLISTGLPSVPPRPDPPTDLIGTSGDGQVTISFTPGNDKGSPIINYEYSIDAGATYSPFIPDTGPVSSVTITDLTNGTTYGIRLKAVNANDSSLETPTFLMTPLPGGADLILFLDGANGGSTNTWNDSSGKLNNCSLTASPTYSVSNGGYYIFNGSTQFGQVPTGFNDFTAGMTVMAFVNFGAANLWERLIDFGNGQANNNIIISRTNTVSNVSFEIYNGIDQPTSFSNTLVNGIVNNQWMFIVARLSGTNYLLRNQFSNNSGASSILPNNIERTNNFIGKSNWSGDSLFEGNIGMIAIYNNDLTDIQINNFFDLFKNRYFTVPDPPTSPSGEIGNQQVSVSFVAPSNTGGLPITSYTVTSNPGGFTASGVTSPIIVSGLTNGTAYTFTAVATNIIGDSVASSPSASVTPGRVPDPPTSLSGAIGDTQVTISFTPPVNTGGYTITSYTVTSSPGGFTASGVSSPITVTGLTNGTPYTFTAIATNARGSSVASSPSAAVTPGRVPDPPTSLSGAVGDTQVTVSFTPPVNTGGYTISSYTVTSSPGGFTASGVSSPITVTGLTNGTPYTFTAIATNARGSSVASSPSASVTPSLEILTRGSMDFPIPNSGKIGSYVQYPNNGTLTIGTQDFTIEWFQYWTDRLDAPRIFSLGSYSDGGARIAMSYEQGKIFFWINGELFNVQGSLPPYNSGNIWTHMAIVGTSGNTITFYINGNYINTKSGLYNISDTIKTLTIANESNANIAATFSGKVTNFRWVVGTPVYPPPATLPPVGTNVFTPPSAPLIAITGTRLLLLNINSNYNTNAYLADSSTFNRTPANTGTIFSSTSPFP